MILDGGKPMQQQVSTLKYKLIIILTILLSIGLFGCGSQPEVEEVRIGVIAYITGDYADASGKPTVQGAELAAQQINQTATLTINGKQIKVKLIIEDAGEGEPEKVVAAALKLINQEDVVAIVGPQHSRGAIPVAEVAEETKIPMISPMSTNPETTANKSYAFRVGFLDPFQGEVMAEFASQDLKAKKVAVLYDIANAYNKGIAEIFKQAFESNGGEVVAFETYITNDTDFSQQLLNIKESEAEVLFLPNYVNEVPLQVQQAHEIGLDIPIIGSDSWDAFDLAQHGTTLEGSFYSTHWNENSEVEQSIAFVNAYKQTYSATDQVHATAALTYDAMFLIFEAIKSQKDITPLAIRNGLADIKNYQGVSGSITYNKTGDPEKNAVIIQVKDNERTFYTTVNPYN